MKKMCKILSVMVIIISVLSISISVQAYSNADVIAYVTKSHTVNGRTVRLDKTQRQSLTNYLKENSVTDSEANEIIAKLDSAKSKIEKSGVTNLSQLSGDLKAEVVSLVKEAGDIAGLDVEVDSTKETITIKDSNGNVIVPATSYSELNEDSNGNKLVYTGNSITVATIIIAVVAIAIVGFVLKNKYAK